MMWVVAWAEALWSYVTDWRLKRRREDALRLREFREYRWW